MLSHDAELLTPLWDYARKVGCTALRIVEWGSESHFEPWNPEQPIAGSYEQNYRKLWDFVNEGTCEDELAMAKRLRPLVEGFMRWLSPVEFAQCSTLGPMVRNLEALKEKDPRHELAWLDEKMLVAINEYASKYHHPAPPAVNRSELKTYTRQAFAIIRGRKPVAT